MRAAPLELLCEWVIRAWDAIDPTIVKSSFKKCGISNSMDGEEDDWIWKDDDGTDNGEWDPYDDGLTDQQMQELFNSDDEEEDFYGF